MRYHTRLVSQQLTVTTSAIATGANIHSGYLTINGLCQGHVPCVMLRSVSLITDTISTIPYDLFLFDAVPTTTFTAAGAQTLTAADQAKVMAVIHLADITPDGGSSIHRSGNLNEALVDLDGLFYASIVARGAVTFAAATDVWLRVYGQAVG